MADAYITEAYVEEHLGKNYVDAVQAVTGIDLDTFIEAATARVQSSLANTGYSTPTTTSDEMVKLAVLGIVREMVSDVPDAAQPLPSDWAGRATNPVRILEEIATGRIPLLGHTLSVPAAVGGWEASDHTDTADGFPRKTTKTELSGY